MSYKLTCYCSACNSTTSTKSGIGPIDGVSVAVHPSKYKKNKIINIEGVGQRTVHDTHGK